MRDLRFRPHHFLCTLGYKGLGYNGHFSRNYTRIVNSLTDDTDIHIVSGVDHICAACPKRINQLCNQQKKIQDLDYKHSRAMGFWPGNKITWRSAKKRIRYFIQPDDLDYICRGCRWLPLGLCKKSVEELLNDKEGS